MRAILVNSTLILVVVLVGCQSKTPSSRPSVALEESSRIGKPTNLKAEAGNRSVKLTWSKVENASSYNIYWSQSKDVSIDDHLIDRISKTSTSHNYLQNGEQYFYRVAAVGQAGQSPLSAEVTATPGSDIPTRQDIVANTGSISGDGNTVAFIGEGCGAPTCIYINNLPNKVEVISSPFASVDDAGKYYFGLNDKGDTLAFSARNGLIIYRRHNETWAEETLSGKPGFSQPSFSKDGNDVLWINAGKLTISTRTNSQWKSEALLDAVSADLSHSGESIVYQNDNRIFFATKKENIWDTAEISEGTLPAVAGNGKIAVFRNLSGEIVVHKIDGGTTQLEMPNCCSEPALIDFTGNLVGYGKRLSKLDDTWSAYHTFADARVVDIASQSKHILYQSGSDLFRVDLDFNDEPIKVNRVEL